MQNDQNVQYAPKMIYLINMYCSQYGEVLINSIEAAYPTRELAQAHIDAVPKDMYYQNEPINFIILDVELTDTLNQRVLDAHKAYVGLQDDYNSELSKSNDEFEPDDSGWHYGIDIDGNKGMFEDFEQSIGEA